MPASTFDSVNAALRNSLSKSTSENNLDAQLAGATKKALLTNIEFEPAGSYQSTVLDKLKTKYIVLKSSETPQTSKQPEKMGADETLTLAKHELYPLEDVQLGWSNIDWAVGAGMVNMGNTCYLNSTLQALFHVPALVNWLLSDKQHMSECEDSGGLCIICAMRKTLQDSQQRNTNSIRPFLIYNKLRVVCRNLIPGRQEDAHEFLRYLVEAMEKAYLNRFKNHSEFDTRTKETTPLNQILGGYLRSTVRCLECGHVSTTFQHFQDLLLDIRKAQTLEEALDVYFSREKLDDESYHCESCQKKVSATKQFSLERAPMVLCIQLKRFSVSNNKITKHVQFRQRLKLTKYARHRLSIPLVYRLVALVTHMGPTVGCGHYTAVAQAPCGNFYQFDDSMVRPISHQAVFNTNAYIMLYELECTSFAHKSSTTNGTIKAKDSPPSTSKCIPIQQTIEKVPTPNPCKLQLNGITNNNKVYGPELPPVVKAEKLMGQNGIVTSTVNGTTIHQDASSSSESEIEHLFSKTPPNKEELNPPSSNSTISDIKSKSPVIRANVNTPACTSLSASTVSSSKDIVHPQDSAVVSSTTQSVTKLVPYEDDEESNCSLELIPTNVDLSARVPTKATTVGDWKVTSSTDTTTHEALSETSKTWEKKKPQQGDRSTVNDLLKMSHSGYSAPVSSWNGTRAQLDKEISNERREERKRPIVDNSEQGRIKHPKVNSNGNFKSNPGYNPIQEYHNVKNWGQSNGSYRFFNTGSRNRNRRNFHHKNNYHKNYRFRQ